MRLLRICLLPTCPTECIFCPPVCRQPVLLNAMATADLSTVDLSTKMHLMPICLPRICPPICVYCRSVNSRCVHINESTADLSTADLSTYMRLLQICLQPTCPPKCVYCRSVFCRPVHLNVSTANLSTAHRSFNSCIPSPRPTCSFSFTVNCPYFYEVILCQPI